MYKLKNNVSRVMIVSVITNTVLALTKVITGVMLTSTALVSDGIHSFSDLLTDVVAIVGGYLSLKPADKKHPYGHGKIEYLTSLIIGVLIILVSFKVIYDSFTSEIHLPSILVVVVSIITIIAKILLSNYIIFKGKKYNNNILIASGRESRMDVVSSIVVLISAILMQLDFISDIFRYSDIVGGIIVGFFIFKAGFETIRENASVVLGEQETDRKYVSSIKRIIKQTDGVVGVKSLVLMKYGHKSNLNLTITMEGKTTIYDAHKIADIIESRIKEFSEVIEYINIHIEPSYEKAPKK